MKKAILLGLAAIAFFATSCENKLGPDKATDGMTSVSFSLNAPVIATKAEAGAMQLQYAVYNGSGSEISELRGTDIAIENGQATVTLQLMEGQPYSIIFWAAAEGAPYTVDFENKKMTIDQTSVTSFDSNGDAFYSYTEFTAGNHPAEVTLSRPFAQVNLGSGDYTLAAAQGYDHSTSTIKITNVPTTLNLVDGTVGDAADVTFAAPSEAFTAEAFPVGGYEYLTKNYVLVGSAKGVVDIEFAYTFGGEAKTRTIGSVPVQRNYRTNIYGNLFTSAVTMSIKLDEAYAGSEEEDLSIVKIYEKQDFSTAVSSSAKAVRFMNDVEHTSCKVSEDISIDLNGKTFTASSGVLQLSGNADVILKNGTYNVNASSGYFDLRPTSTDGCSLVAEKVTFTNSYLKSQSTGKTNGTNNRTGDMLKTYPMVAGNIKIKLHFKDCIFNNALISFGGSSDKLSDLDVTFENCTFNALTSTKIIDIGGYTTGTFKLDGCTFNLTCTSSSACGLNVSTFSNCTVRVEATDNTMNAVIAEKYTDASDDKLSIYVPYTPRNIKLINYSVNNYCTVVETNTTGTGIAVGATN